jgi:hypothetical protein
MGRPLATTKTLAGSQFAEISFLTALTIRRLHRLLGWR